MKVSKQNLKKIEELEAKWSAARSELDAAQDEANDAIQTAVEKLNTKIGELNAILEEANTLRDEIHSDAQAEFDGKSEKWQEGEKGEAGLAELKIENERLVKESWDLGTALDETREALRLLGSVYEPLTGRDPGILAHVKRTLAMDSNDARATRDERIRREAAMCDACSGTGQIPDGECGCGGTGNIHDMLRAVRLALHDAQRREQHTRAVMDACSRSELQQRTVDIPLWRAGAEKARAQLSELYKKATALQAACDEQFGLVNENDLVDTARWALRIYLVELEAGGLS